MKKILVFAVVFCCTMAAIAQTQPNNEIWYTSSTGQIIQPYAQNVFGANILSNEYDAEAGRGVITFDDAVRSIGESAFCQVSDLTSISIPDCVTSLDTRAFSGCSGLASVAIPNTVTRIGDFAFYVCQSLTTITIPGSVRSIGEFAFSASSLTSVIVPASVTSIGESAFQDCRNLTSASISNSVTNIGKFAFNRCSNLTSVNIPDNVTSIEAYTFEGCSKLASITIPNSVTSIGGNAFYYCSGLISVTIPSSVTSIGERAFQYCLGLISVTIPSSVTSVGKGAFQACSGLASVTIPSSVTKIRESTFEGCSGLTSFTIPGSVTQIDYSAFYNCSGLAYMVVLPTDSPTLGSYAFSNVSKDIPVFVPNVENYASWGGFTNIQTFGLDAVKEAAIAVIDAAMAGATNLTNDDIQTINNCKAAISNATEHDAIDAAKNTALDIIRLRSVKNDVLAAIDSASEEATTLTEADLQLINGYKAAIDSATGYDAIVVAKNAAMAIIILQPAKYAALAEIEAALQGESSAFLAILVEEQIDAINSATDVTAITDAKDIALQKLNMALPIYNAGKAAAFGEMGEPCEDCPAVDVSKGTKNIRLYNPEKVEFLKTTGVE